MVEFKIGKKTHQMKFISWGTGSALVPFVEDGATAVTMSAEISPGENLPSPKPAERKIIGVRPDGKILRLFPAVKTSHALTPAD